MPRCMSTITCFSFIGIRGRNLNPPTGHELQVEGLGRSEPLNAPALFHTLDDDSLLNIFYCCRPVLSDEDEADGCLTFYGGRLDCERWWYKPAQVCRRWRYIILGSVSHLGLCLICTYGTPVADMLAHSPPLPLIIDLIDKDYHVDTQLGDEERVILAMALQHRDRVRGLRLQMRPGSNSHAFLLALDGGFPMLESLYIAFLAEAKIWFPTVLKVPETLDTPHLRHLVLYTSSYASLRPNNLLRWLLRLPQLETLRLEITFYTSLFEVLPIVMHVTLPHLRWFAFQGHSAYLEALLPQITTPVLEKLQISLSNMQTFSFPLLQQFVNTTGDLSGRSARLTFQEDSVSVTMYHHEGTKTYTLHVKVDNGKFDQQVAFAVQIFGVLGAIFSMVESLTLEYWKGVKWSIWHNESNRTQWRELLRTFSQVKTLRVAYHLVGELSCALRVDEDAGESAMELLPELRELSCFVGNDTRELFTSFILARRNSGCPVTLVPVMDHAMFCDGHDSELRSTASAAQNG